MKTVSEYVQEAVDLMESGSYEFALAPTVAAISETAKNAFEKDDLSEDDYRKFIKENWQLITFMGMPRALPLPLNSENFGVKGFLEVLIATGPADTISGKSSGSSFGGSSSQSEPFSLTAASI